MDYAETGPTAFRDLRTTAVDLWYVAAAGYLPSYKGLKQTWNRTRIYLVSGKGVSNRPPCPCPLIYDSAYIRIAYILKAEQ